MKAPDFPALFQRCFLDRLGTQMEASPNTVSGSRDTFRLLLHFAMAKLGKPPTKLDMEDLNVDLIADFLMHIETARHNVARTRNTRLAAIRSFFRFVAMTEPTYALRVLRQRYPPLLLSGIPLRKVGAVAFWKETPLPYAIQSYLHLVATARFIPIGLPPRLTIAAADGSACTTTR